ncbi:MAG TPA: hypothetical protein VN822_12470 [Candidatus Acidoferrales bacterium]|nr:hypothetical protein [Candidatus Acidoferrales bacterium]
MRFWNAPGACGSAIETLKDAIDPNGILAAGQYGIWPKHLKG